MGTLIGLRFRTFASHFSLSMQLAFLILFDCLESALKPRCRHKGGSLDNITYTYCRPELTHSEMDAIHTYIHICICLCMSTHFTVNI